jgi:probable phosphomutase (TIGR03848 family)
MRLLLLLRHAVTEHTGARLSGWMPGLHLSEAGREQAGALAGRLEAVPLDAIYASPLERCQETAAPLAEAKGLKVETLDDVGEVRYGDWTGRTLKELAKEPLWKVVQTQPSAATFPGGESLATMQARVVDAVRRRDAAIEAEHGPGAVWVAVSHGDLVKAVLADALGMHLDQFQRIVVDPASVSVVTYTPLRPFVVRANDVGGDLSFLAPRPKRTRRRKGATASTSDAAVGGGPGTSA